MADAKTAYEQFLEIDPTGRRTVVIRVADLVIMLQFVPTQFRQQMIDNAIQQLNAKQ